MKTVIFNSGLGKRMGDLTKCCHKSMVRLADDQTIFERQIRVLSSCGIDDFVVTTGPFKEQLEDVGRKKEFQHLRFTYVENEDYETTNYICSMFLAREFLDDDVLLLHGDLVFDKNIVKEMLKKTGSLALINPKKELPDKDFKGRVKNGELQEVSIDIFDTDCYAFQPLYKLTKSDLESWLEVVGEFIADGNVKVYAENALNTILPSLHMKTMSYENHFVEECDTQDDLIRVSKEIRFFDFEQQDVLKGYGKHCEIDRILKDNKSVKPFIVCDRVYDNLFIKDYIDSLSVEPVIFQDFSPNPNYADVVKGVEKFKDNDCDFIISIGGGSSIDVAKCIKMFSVLDGSDNYLTQHFKYSPVRHLSIPTTSGTGSEATRFAVIYYNGEKQSVQHDCVLPDYVILNPEFIRTVPYYQKCSTVLDALCQGIESFWSVNSNSQSKKYAEASIRGILENISGYLDNDDTCLEAVMNAAYYAGKAINITQTTAAHAMSYKITSMYNVAHGHAVAMVLPHLWRFMLNNLEQCNDARGQGYLSEMFLNLSNVCGVGSSLEAIEVFENIFDNMKLNKVKIDSMDDIEVLLGSVNSQRLSNNPISLSSGDIARIYKTVLL